MWSELAVDEMVSPEMFAWNSEERGAVVASTFYEMVQGDGSNSRNKNQGKVCNPVQMMQQGGMIAPTTKIDRCPSSRAT